MQFALIAYDGKDEGALERRMAAREGHLAKVRELVANGQALYGAALHDDAGTMIGSMMVLEFPSRAELDAWLTVEPYVVGKVWENITVIPCQTAPSFVR